MKKVLFCIVLLGFDVVAQANKTELDIGYLCIAEKASGFSFGNGGWTPQQFKTDSKYVLKKTGERLYSLTNFGSNFPSIKDCELSSSGTFISCVNIFGSLKFSSETKRFIKSYLVGYVSGADSELDTPHIEIGVCTEI